MRRRIVVEGVLVNRFFKKYPIPVAGLVLGLASAGNLIQAYGDLYRNLLGIISVMLLMLLIIKFIGYPTEVKENLQNPVIAGVFPTSSMAIMILSTYLRPYILSLSYIIWIIGFVLHVCLIVWFTRKFVVNFMIRQVFPVWFVVYVGIATASITGPVYDLIIVSKIVFWYGFISYIILLPIVTYRVVIIKELSEQILPTLAIFLAPPSLLLAGYMNSFQIKNMIIIWILIILSLSMYCVVLIMLPKLLRLKFYPSYSSFTFPLIVSGIAVKKIIELWNNEGQSVAILQYFSKFQELLGIALTIYVLIRYLKFLFFDKNNEHVNYKTYEVAGKGLFSKNKNHKRY